MITNDEAGIDAVLEDSFPASDSPPWTLGVSAAANGHPRHEAGSSGVTTYEITREGRAWRIKLAGDGFTEWAMTKEDAVARARVLAARAPNGRVVVSDVKTDVESDPSPELPSKPS